MIGYGAIGCFFNLLALVIRTTKKVTFKLPGVFHFVPIKQPTTKKNVSSQIPKSSFSRGTYFGSQVGIKTYHIRVDVFEHHVKQEISILHRLRHQNIIQYIGTYFERIKSNEDIVNVGVVMDYCMNCDLLSFVTSTAPMDWNMRIRIGYEIASAIAYLHCNGFIHKNLKSTNILLDDNFHCKLSGFNFLKPPMNSIPIPVPLPVVINDNHNTSTDNNKHSPNISTEIETKTVNNVRNDIKGVVHYNDDDDERVRDDGVGVSEDSDMFDFGIVLLEIISSKPILLKIPQ
eukprot:gene11437-23925_t